MLNVKGCPVNCVTAIYICIAAYGKKGFCASWGFLAAVPRVATRKTIAGQLYYQSGIHFL